MDSRLIFLVLAAAMIALALGLILPFVLRGMRHKGLAARRHSWIATAALVLGAPALAFAVYSFAGDWDAVGGERSALSEQLLEGALPNEGNASAHVYAELERQVQRHPSDARALVLKARLDMRAERYEQAAAAFEKAVAGTSRAANDPGVWVEYAEARGMAQGRKLVGEPLRLVHRALALDANHPQALDLAGSAAWEAQDFANAVNYWRRLLEQIPPDSARHAELSLAVGRAEQRARMSLPSTASTVMTR